MEQCREVQKHKRTPSQVYTTNHDNSEEKSNCLLIKVIVMVTVTDCDYSYDAGAGSQRDCVSGVATEIGTVTSSTAAGANHSVNESENDGVAVTYREIRKASENESGIEILYDHLAMGCGYRIVGDDDSQGYGFGYGIDRLGLENCRAQQGTNTKTSH